jgi:hypothetical protein
MFSITKGEAMKVYLVSHNDDGFVRRVFASYEDAERDIQSLYQGTYYYNILEYEVR